MGSWHREGQATTCAKRGSSEDDIGDVDEHPGGGVETGDTGEGLDTAERTASEMVNARGRTVTLRDFMAFYLFTRRGTSPWLLLFFQFST